MTPDWLDTLYILEAFQQLLLGSAKFYNLWIPKI